MLQPMSRNERLDRWAALLEHTETCVLTPFRDVELLDEATRRALRAANSPVAIAYADPLLRRAGLTGDRFGDAAEFFGLSRYQAHRVLCSCGYTGHMRASEVARRLRGIVARDRLLSRLTRLVSPNPLPALARRLAAPRLATR